jgi:hypothetical protein
LTFTNHPLFQELVPAAHIAVEKFYQDYRDYKTSAAVFTLSGLNARVNGSRTPLPKRSKRFTIIIRTYLQGSLFYDSRLELSI